MEVLYSLLQLLHEREDLRLDGDVEGRGRLVGYEQRGVAGEGDGYHDALAHTAGEEGGIVPVHALAVGYAGLAQHIEAALLTLGVGYAGSVYLHLLVYLRADGEQGVERGQRLLEYHRHAAAAQGAPLLRPEGGDVAAHELYGVCGIAAGLLYEAHDGERGDALAAAALADDAEDLAAVHVEVHALDGVQAATAGLEVDVQVPDVQYSFLCQNCRPLYRIPWFFGSSTSRSQLPRNMMASTVSVMATPGKVQTHHCVAR